MVHFRLRVQSLKILSRLAELTHRFISNSSLILFEYLIYHLLSCNVIILFLILYSVGRGAIGLQGAHQFFLGHGC